MTSEHDPNEVLETLLEEDARTIANTHQPHPVPKDTCQKWRQHLEAETSLDVLDWQDYTRATLRKHVQGDCQHPTTWDSWPVTYDEEVWVRRRLVSAGTRLESLHVYHTRPCKQLPDELRVLPRDERGTRWRVCGECSGRVPEATPLQDE